MSACEAALMAAAVDSYVTWASAGTMQESKYVSGEVHTSTTLSRLHQDYYHVAQQF